MAYNADIIVRLVESEVDKAVKRIERKLKGLQDAANKVEIGSITKGTRELRGFEKRIDAVNRSLERIKPTATIGAIGAVAAGSVGGVEKLAQALQGVGNLGPAFGKVTSALNSFGSSLEQSIGPAGKLGATLLDFASSAPATAAGIGLATASLFAFAPAIKQATSDIFNFKTGFQNLVRSITAGGLIAFDSLNQKFEMTRRGLIELAKGAGSLSFLKEELKEAKKSLSEMDSTADNFRQETERLIEAEVNVNNELRARKRIYDELNVQQQQIRQNVDASRSSRKDTGFPQRNDFDIFDPVAKSIRRNQQKIQRQQANRRKVAIDQAPLALPSSEMLDAAAKGIKRIRKEAEVISIPNEVTEKLDFINQKGTNFVESLRKGKQEAGKLPPIFDKVNQSLKQITTGFDAANKKAKRLQGGPAGGVGSVGPVQKRTAALKNLATLERKIITDTDRLRETKALKSYNTRRKRIKFLAKKQQEADRKSAQKRDRIVSSGLIGGAFPLLFGQGAGAALGGGIGGAAGGAVGGQMGFALSLVGTQFGAFADQIVSGAATLGAALNPLTADLDALTEAAGITGSQTAQLISKLEEAGLSSAALKLATQELERVVGTGGVKALRDFATTTQEVGNDVQKLGTILKATFANLFNTLVITPEETRLKQEGESIAAARETQDPALQAQFQALNNASSIEERLAIRQRILTIIEKTNNSLANKALLEKEGKQRAENELNLGIQSEQTQSLRLQALAAEGVERERLVDLAAKSVLQDQFKLEKQQLINQAIKGEISFRAVALKLKGKEIDLQEALKAIDDKTSTGQQKNLDVSLKKQEDLLEASVRTLKVQQNKFKALGAETRSQQALLSFISKKADIERRAEEQIKAIREAGGPTADTAVANIQETERLAIAGQRLLLEERISKVIEGVNRPLDQIIEKNKDQLAFNAEYQELLATGVKPELAKQLAQIEVIFDKSLDKLNAEINSAEALRLQNKLNDEQIKQLDRLIEQRGLLEGKRGTAKRTATDVENSKPGKIQSYMDQLKDELGDTQGMIVSLAQTIEGEIGSAMSTAITNVITGTGTVQEAMSTMFANIGKAFIDMATQMIAKALIMKALGIFLPGAGAGAGATDSFAGVPNNILDSVLGTKANGGPTRPNGTYLVGEQGPELLSMGNQPGYVHRNTSEAMDRYRGGGGSGSGAAGNLNINYNVTDINGMRFVTEDQFRTGMTQAARDGAARGEASTFRTLRNSRSSRSRVGL